MSLIMRQDTLKLQVIPLRMPFLFIKNYSYLGIHPASHEAVIIDPTGKMEKIEQALAEAEAVLRGILITHAHPDHIQLVNPLVKKYNCPVWMFREEIAASGFNCNRLIGLAEIPWSVGEIKIKPFLTPGHTLGSACYLIEDNLFTGDTLFTEGCGSCFGDRAATQTLFASLQYLKREITPETRIFPGHSYGKKPGNFFSSLLQENIYLQFNNREDFCAYRLRKGQKNLFNFRWGA